MNLNQAGEHLSDDFELFSELGLLCVGDGFFDSKNLDDRYTFEYGTASDPEELAFIAFVPTAIAFGNVERDGEGGAGELVGNPLANLFVFPFEQ